jgi:ABC-2 type transport system permease protein
MMVFKQFVKLTLTELKLFCREPIAVFFTFIFPVFFLFLTMEIFVPADAPKEIVINYATPCLMVLVIASPAIFGIPVTIVSYRKIKFLKRLKGSPVTPLTILGSLALANFVVTLLGIALLAATAMLVYDASLAGSLISFLGGFVLAFLSVAAIFLFIPAVARSERMAITISQVVFLPVVFFSGVVMPLDRLPEWIRSYISPYLPVTHAVELMQGLWLGMPLSDLSREVFILLGVFCLGLVIAARTFRWE